MSIEVYIGGFVHHRQANAVANSVEVLHFISASSISTDDEQPYKLQGLTDLPQFLTCNITQELNNSPGQQRDRSQAFGLSATAIAVVQCVTSAGSPPLNGPG